MSTVYKIRSGVQWNTFTSQDVCSSNNIQEAHQHPGKTVRSIDHPQTFTHNTTNAQQQQYVPSTWYTAVAHQCSLDSIFQTQDHVNLEGQEKQTPKNTTTFPSMTIAILTWKCIAVRLLLVVQRSNASSVPALCMYYTSWVAALKTGRLP